MPQTYYFFDLIQQLELWVWDYCFKTVTRSARCLPFPLTDFPYAHSLKGMVKDIASIPCFSTNIHLGGKHSAQINLTEIRGLSQPVDRTGRD